MSNRSTNAPGRLRLSRRALAAFTVASALLLTSVAPAFAVNVNTFESPVTQNFNTLPPATAAATLPTDFKADSNQTFRTVGSYASAGTATTQTASQPATNAQNGIYNFGAGANNNGTDRAVGFIGASGAGNTNSGNIYAKYTNTTGSSIDKIRVSYDVEKYRNGSNPAGFRIQMYYSTNGTTWTSAGASYLTSFAADANNNSCATAPCSTTPVAPGLLTIPATANNADFYLAWNYSVTSGTTNSNAQGLAVDNISVAAVGGPLGATGVKTTDVQATDDGGYAMALQPDGRTVVGGYATDLANGDKEFALVRYNYDGSLDTTFGGTGKVVTDFNGTSDRIWGIALQSDGKIVAAGETVSAVFPGTNDIAVARYNTNGTLDATFGGTGKVTTDHALGANNAANAVTISGTNIIVAGYETVSGNNDFMVARYTSAGVLDPTFGTLGVTTTGFSGFSDVARAVAIDGSNRIVVGGHASNGTDDDFAVARYTSGGVLDAAFVAGAGKAAVNIFGGGSADQAFALAIDPTTQNIFLAGSAYNPSTSNKDFALVSYNSAGALQNITTTDFGNSPDVAQALAIQSDGKIVAAGLSRYSTSSDDFALARYTAAGALDTTFDGDGKLTMKISNADERAYGVAQDFAGKIVAAGFAAVPGVSPVTRNFALARFNSNGTLDASTPTTLNSPDLLVQITGPDNPNSVIAGSPFQWSVTVTNRGGAPATNVVLTDTLPAGVTYGGAIVSNGGVNVAGNVITNNVGTLNPGDTASLDIDVTAGNTPTLVANTAAATLSETDAAPSNNTATEYTRIVGIYDLSFSPSTVTGGCQNSTGTVTLTGPAPAGGVSVQITSTSPAVASAPASVLVPGGASGAQFPVTTGTVVANTTARFEVVLGPTSFVRRINVNTGCN